MKNQKKQQKRPQFNQYWIFGSIILVFLLLNIFSGAGSQTSANITPSKFFEFTSNGDVERIEIINKREVFVYLTRDARIKDEHKNSSKNSLLSIGAKNPNYRFEFGDLQNFENKLSQVNKDFNQNIEVNYITEQNIWGDIIVSMLPFIVIIAIWVFIMRRMSGGAGPGGGGQIFNIWKYSV